MRTPMKTIFAVLFIGGYAGHVHASLDSTKYVDYLSRRDSVIRSELFPTGGDDGNEYSYEKEIQHLRLKGTEGFIKPTYYYSSLRQPWDLV
jgi:hypothetical protein